MDIVAPYPAIYIMNKFGRRKSYLLGLLLLIINLIVFGIFDVVNQPGAMKYLIIIFKIISNMLCTPVMWTYVYEI